MHELERENTMQYEEKEASATRQEKLEQDSAEMIDETLLFHGRKPVVLQSIRWIRAGEHTYQFMGFESAKKLGYTIEGKDYRMVYAAPWTPTITLEDIFERFNINRPNDFSWTFLIGKRRHSYKPDGGDKGLLCGFFRL